QHATTSPYRFPYTTLFRSELVVEPAAHHREALADVAIPHGGQAVIGLAAQVDIEIFGLEGEIGGGLRLEAEARRPAEMIGRLDRSEEHTSELQSRENLVCR